MEATSAASASIPVGGEPAGSEETRTNGLLDGLKIIAENTAQKDRAERLAVGQAPVVFDTADSPACTDCGSIMVRNGSCYKCINLVGLTLPLGAAADSPEPSATPRPAVAAAIPRRMQPESGTSVVGFGRRWKVIDVTFPESLAYVRRSLSPGERLAALYLEGEGPT